MNNAQVAIDYLGNTIDREHQNLISYFNLVSENNASDYISPIINFNEEQLAQQSLGKNDSQDLYETFTPFFGESRKLPGYSFINVFPYVKNIAIDNAKIDNIDKLRQIGELKDGWDGDYAKAFDDSLLKTVLNIIINLNYQPEIFPTACDTIQIEYEKEDGSYLEIEIGDNDSAKIFMLDSEGKEKTTYIVARSQEINGVVNSFYE